MVFNTNFVLGNDDPYDWYADFRSDLYFANADEEQGLRYLQLWPHVRGYLRLFQSAHGGMPLHYQPMQLARLSMLRDEHPQQDGSNHIPYAVRLLQ